MAKRVTCVNPTLRRTQDMLASEASPHQCKCMAKQDKSREERLAEALRENLRKRKAQARQSKSEDRPRRD
jgi:hypothetical protein